jgi:uncharacterized membrane protein
MNDEHPQASGSNAAVDELRQAKNITMLVYALQAASFFFGITAIAAVIINYLKREDVQNTWLASHFRWQIRTFWFGLLWCAIGGLTVVVGIGFVMLGIAGLWLIYRVVKGWLRLSEGKEMYSAQIK